MEQIAIEKEKCRKNLNKPVYIGTSILNLSKILMQDFHYNYIKNKYGDKTEMLLTDTDNFVYKTETENVYNDLHKSKDIFDLSNYPKDSKYYSGANSLVLCKMEDEISGVPIKGFVKLKSKMYT